MLTAITKCLSPTSKLENDHDHDWLAADYNRLAMRLVDAEKRAEVAEDLLASLATSTTTRKGDHGTRSDESPTIPERTNNGIDMTDLVLEKNLAMLDTASATSTTSRRDRLTPRRYSTMSVYDDTYYGPLRQSVFLKAQASPPQMPSKMPFLRRGDGPNGGATPRTASLASTPNTMSARSSLTPSPMSTPRSSSIPKQVKTVDEARVTKRTSAGPTRMASPRGIMSAKLQQQQEQWGSA